MGFSNALVSLTNVEMIKNHPTIVPLPHLIILNKRKLYCNWSLWHHIKKAASYPTWVLIQGLINQNDYPKPFFLWPVNLLAYEIEESLGLWISYSCKIPPEFPKFPKIQIDRYYEKYICKKNSEFCIWLTVYTSVHITHIFELK